MKKIILLIFILIFVVGCSNSKDNPNSRTNSRTQPSGNTTIVRQSVSDNKSNIDKKYRGLQLMSTPQAFRGTWYRSDANSKDTRKLIITKHLIDDSVLYKKVSKIRLDHNSEKQNKEYAGNISIGQVGTIKGRQSLSVRDVLGSVSIIYLVGNFKGHPCLYLAYSFGDYEIHGALFKNPQTAIKYRKYDFSQVK
ncbi:hypothetical protein J2Z60_001849 [Lactobacillus colini]|uniref:Lipoprotein n=1 Tax=Lactobacillus colini TaxID=1819254 RepID=A0ABS4MG43_9LACO|nr:hypothetical protein [Lactobacillus colini]MBP2058661.1 hypothetical protein [Lactobacillus colini]